MIRSCAIRRLSAIDPGPTTTRKDRFSVYLAYFVDYGTTYGSLGAAIGLLFYLYLSAAVVLVGAEVNTVVYHHGIDKQTGKEAMSSGSARLVPLQPHQARDGWYGDLVHSTAVGKLFTVFYVFAGVGIILAFVEAGARASVAQRDETRTLPRRRSRTAEPQEDDRSNREVEDRE